MMTLHRPEESTLDKAKKRPALQLMGSNKRNHIELAEAPRKKQVKSGGKASELANKASKIAKKKRVPVVLG